jgi:molybdopterin-guanine dinucleotide biosynthesis protein A
VETLKNINVFQIKSQTNLRALQQQSPIVLKRLEKDCHALFVPIDMPFLTVDCLKVLMDSEAGAFFSGFPLPAFLKRTERVEESPKNVRELLIRLGARPIELPKKYEQDMLNINTREEWREALKNETENRRARVYIQD